MSARLFYTSLNQSLSKQQEKPVATVSAKTKTVQRKFSNRVVWDRLSKDSPLYNGDTVHTAPFSSVTVEFTTGAVLSLSENAMVQIETNKDGTLAVVSQGSVSVDTTAAAVPLALTVSGTELSVPPGSQVRAEAAEGNADFAVSQGAAAFSDGTTVSEGESISLHTDGTRTIESKLLVIEPPPFLQLSHEEESPRVHFAWCNAPGDMPLELLVSRDEAFSDIVAKIAVTGLAEVDVPLSEGFYHWAVSASEIDESTKAEPLCTGRVDVTFEKQVPPVIVEEARSVSLLLPSELPPVAGELPLEAGNPLSGEPLSGKPVTAEPASAQQIPDTPAAIRCTGYVSQEMLTKLRDGVLAFSHAHVIVTVDLAEAHLVRIPDGAFTDCERLGCIILPASITHIDAASFNGCPRLTTIKYTGTEEQWQRIEIDDETVRAIVPECGYHAN